MPDKVPPPPVDRPPIPDEIRGRDDVDRLLAALTNYEERLPADRSKFDLARTEALLAAVGHPEVGPRTVHVAGSKGKGTVVRLVAHGLLGGGRRVGCYTSPHLVDLRERIAIDGRSIDDDAFARSFAPLLPHLECVGGTPLEPTFFELVTAAAWLAFRAAGCTDVVLETGLGGRLDATNVCRPTVTVITSIELEHTRLLGDTLAKIAAEKAGILKPGIPAVTTASGEALAMIEGVAASLGAPLTVIGRDVALTDVTTGPGPRLAFDMTTTLAERVVVPLAGVHHAGNVAAACSVLRALDVRAPAKQLADVRLPGLLESVADDPLVLVDGAHTPHSARATRAALAACWPGQRVVWLTAMLDEKLHAEIGAALGEGISHAVVTQVASPRCAPAAALAALLRGVVVAPVEAIDDLGAALDRARSLARPDGLVLAAGSVYLAGDVKRRLR